MKQLPNYIASDLKRILPILIKIAEKDINDIKMMNVGRLARRVLKLL